MTHDSTTGGYRCGHCGSWIPSGITHTCTFAPAVLVDPAFWPPPTNVNVVDLSAITAKLDEILAKLHLLEELMNR